MPGLVDRLRGKDDDEPVDMGEFETVAVDGSCSPQPNTHAPLFSIFLLSASTSLYACCISSCGVAGWPST